MKAILTAGDEEGTLYLKYMINDDTTYTSLENEQPATNAGLDATAKIKVNVTAKPFDGSVQAEGTTTIYVGEEPVNLIGNEDIKGYAVDSTDKKIPVHLSYGKQDLTKKMESSLRITGYLLQRKEPIRFGQHTEANIQNGLV